MSSSNYCFLTSNLIFLISYLTPYLSWLLQNLKLSIISSFLRLYSFDHYDTIFFWGFLHSIPHLLLFLPWVIILMFPRFYSWFSFSLTLYPLSVYCPYSQCPLQTMHYWFPKMVSVSYLSPGSRPIYMDAVKFIHVYTWQAEVCYCWG